MGAGLARAGTGVRVEGNGDGSGASEAVGKGKQGLCVCKVQIKVKGDSLVVDEAFHPAETLIATAVWRSVESLRDSVRSLSG